MFAQFSLDDQLKQNERKLKEIGVRFESMNREIDAFFGEIGVTPEQLKKYLETEENFTPEQWQQIQLLRREHNDKVQNKLDQISDPTQTSKRYEERRVANHWIFVR